MARLAAVGRDKGVFEARDKRHPLESFARTKVSASCLGLDSSPPAVLTI